MSGDKKTRKEIWAEKRAENLRKNLLRRKQRSQDMKDTDKPGTDKPSNKDTDR